jgi:hypothetical protein
MDHTTGEVKVYMKKGNGPDNTLEDRIRQQKTKWIRQQERQQRKTKIRQGWRTD